MIIGHVIHRMSSIFLDSCSMESCHEVKGAMGILKSATRMALWITSNIVEFIHSQQCNRMANGSIQFYNNSVADMCFEERTCEPCSLTQLPPGTNTKDTTIATYQ